ncbi:MAG: carboxypeptidase-like regulatory domain-containing protein [Gemmatimonadaceae bacterium]
MSLALGAACRHQGECIVTPGCPPETAAQISLTSAATNSPVTGATVTINGDAAHAMSCDGTCFISADAGKYVIDISAPGFAPAERTIVVTSSERQSDVYGPAGYEGKGCACEIVDQQSLTVALTPLG